MKTNTIDRLIAGLESNPSLCSAGRERVRWWKRNRRNFKTINAALLTWDAEHIAAFVSYMEIEPPKRSAASRFESISFFRNAHLPKEAIILRRLIARTEKIHLAAIWHAWVKRTPEERFIPRVW